MANEQNLIPVQSGKEAREKGKKGGIASGKVRREKANLRKMAQALLDGTFTDINGEQVSGIELVQMGLIQNISSPDGKNWGKAMDLLVTLTGANMSPEQRANIRANTAKTKAEVSRMNGSNETHNGILENLIKGLQDNDVHSKTESPDADVAEGAVEET